MKLKTNPLLEDHGPVYKFFYYAGPVMLIAAFLLLWNSVSAAGKVMLPSPLEALERMITIWSGNVAKHPMIYHVGISMRRVLTALVFSVVVGVPLGIMVPEINFQVGKVFGAKSTDMLFDVVLPSSLNAIFAGIRTALGGGWMVLLASEMLGAREGIGFLIMQGSSANDLTLSIVGMVMIGFFGALFAYGFDFLERWLCPWKRK